MKEFLLILSMWGLNAEGDWLYIGNQYILNTPMTIEQCNKIIEQKAWSMHLTNEYYRIQFDCMHQSQENK